MGTFAATGAPHAASHRPPRKKLTTAISLLTTLVLIALMLAVVLGLVLPAAIGSRSVVVFSGSMEPALQVGGLAFVQPVEPETVKPGDIIVYHPDHDTDITLCHRVVEVIEDPALAFHTKGDANEEVDPWDVPATCITGRVSFDVPYAGYVLHYTGRYVRTRLGLALLIALPLAVLTTLTARDIVQWRTRKWEQPHSS